MLHLTLTTSLQKKKMKTLHSLASPVQQISNSISLTKANPLLINTRLSLCDFLPDSSRARFDYIQTLEKNGLSCPIMLLTHSSGNNIGNLHFVWKLPADKSIETTFEESVKNVETIKQILPQYHT